MTHADGPSLALPGSVAAGFPDAGVAAHYGDPHGEQRALATAAGVVDRSNRDVLRIAGADRLSWLNSISTQKLDELAPGTATQSLILSPHGHVEHHLTLVDDGTLTWIHVEPGEAPSLLAFLDSMRFMLRVTPEDVSAGYAVLTVAGPAAPPPPGATAAALTFPFGTDLVVPRDRLGDVMSGLRERDCLAAGIWAHEALRIAGHRARFGTDTDHRTIPHEVGWIEPAVHLNKGCYRGQETVARVQNLGHPPRRLVMLHLDGGEDRLPAHGEPVAEGSGSVVGFVGSAARHFELGPVALAVIKRTVPVTAALVTAGISAAQEVIVAPETGAHARSALDRWREDQRAGGSER